MSSGKEKDDSGNDNLSSFVKVNFDKVNFDKAFFDEVYAKYYPVILRHAAYLTGSVEAAEDIVQDAFIKLYNTPPSHSNTIAWLSTVVSNLSYNFIRNEKNKKRKEPDIAEHEEDKVISIEDKVLRNHEIILVRKVLQFLPPRDRMCLLLKFSGYKYDEIAEVIQVGKSSVGTILSRAQAKFKEKYLKEV